MPRLKLFGKELNIGGDDFVVPGSIEVILRAIGLLVLIAEFSRFHHELDCDSEHFIFTYLLGLKVFSVLVIILDMLIVNSSSKGTIIYDSPRRNLYKYLYARIFVLVLETLWTIMGSVSIIRSMDQCEGRIYNLACAAVVGGWLTSFIQTVFILVFFDFNTKDHQPVITKHDWEKRWKDVFCCLSAEENKDVFSFLAGLCVQLFKKEKLVASDIVAGLILVYEKQKVTRQHLDVTDARLIEGKLRSKPNKVAMSPGIERKIWMTFSEAAHYMKFAFGSYGWFYYIGLNNPVAATLRLLPKLNWVHRTDKDGPIQGDGKYQANTAAFLLQTGVSPDQIILSCFHNQRSKDVVEIPFVVTVDKDSSSVIVSIRGTLSIEDVLTDAEISRDEVRVTDSKGREVQGKVHKGMNRSAKYIYKILERGNILGKAFENHETYKLVITGHSLGAGVATLLSIKLRLKYHDLRCFAFAPPGELISASLVPYTEEFVCSVVLGYDIVPRLGLKEMIDLKISILEEIEHCNQPKAAHCFYLSVVDNLVHSQITALITLPIRKQIQMFKVISSGLLSRCISSIPSVMCQDVENCEQFTTFQAYINEEKKERDRIVTHFEPLLPPGQILHVLEEQTTNRAWYAWNAEPNYYAEWTDAQPFREIIVSKRLIAHHFPDTLLNALRQLATYENVIPPTYSSTESPQSDLDRNTGYNLRSKKKL